MALPAAASSVLLTTRSSPSPRPSSSRNSLSISTALSSPSSSTLSSTYSKQLPRSPLISSPRRLPSPVPRPLKSNLASSDGQSSGRSSISSTIVDVLSEGDIVGDGLYLQGEMTSLVSISSSEPRVDYDEPAKEFEVVRKLGTGSYAVVYLVREVLSRPLPSDDGHATAAGRMDFDDGSYGNISTEYGREYAIKLLSKANLDEDALAAQLFEVRLTSNSFPDRGVDSSAAQAMVHQSLPAHPNIVTLHRTLETPSFLLLLLEFVPGEDLFYFLEQARDHYDTDPELSSSPPNSDSSCASRTPPTPSLLSSLNPAQLLSRRRLRLIASMFSQMCDAVATCHDNSVFHRDIKPENFIVTDGWTTLSDGRCERKVIVKLTDFGLSTTDTESADMDCGSAPYMSFECRNNIHPTYSPRAADVWSLGIVLINMLYHYNPWTDTTEGVCSSFELYRQQPVNFFMQRFTGMTLPVAEFLTTKVFCVLDNPKDDSQRVSAHAFGAWIKDLPALLGASTPSGHTRNISISSVQGHRLASIPHSRRPSLRNASSAEPPSQRVSRAMSRAPSLGPAYEVEAELAPIMLSPVHSRDDEQAEPLPETESRSTSTHKRRKRGARARAKGSLVPPASIHDDTLDTLAEASQALAREISRNSRTPHSVEYSSSPAPVPIPPSPTTPASISKKSSKWKLSFGKGSAAAGKISSAVEEVPAERGRDSVRQAHLHDSEQRHKPADEPERAAAPSDRPPVYTPAAGPNASSMWGPSGSGALAHSSPLDPRGSTGDKRSERGISPSSTRSGRPLASSASSTASSNWRSSMSSAGTSTSAFTRYSNNSARSVSTAATSVSSTSWRSQTNKYPYDNKPSQMPANVKFVTGTPWELYQLPRQMYPNPDDAKFGAPPVRKRRAPKAKDPMLDTINERPLHQKSPLAQRLDAATSTTDLDHLARERDSSGSHEGDEHEGSPRKVQKGQINALPRCCRHCGA
ncbi:Negative regulator of sexual conjugation and meiosis [Grifola frondosa]|uniref:non-specific serine/threonine protein kinase n=1 Tax=Grifola frondosa TaxID=5627 RepID=A0A1C7LR74_GRIFR|nr:Negative regulator of sexual conjugation and meiosis [Grifola frondosa]